MKRDPLYQASVLSALAASVFIHQLFNSWMFGRESTLFTYSIPVLILGFLILFVRPLILKFKNPTVCYSIDTFLVNSLTGFFIGIAALLVSHMDLGIPPLLPYIIVLNFAISFVMGKIIKYSIGLFILALLFAGLSVVVQIFVAPFAPVFAIYAFEILSILAMILNTVSIFGIFCNMANVYTAKENYLEKA